MPGHLSSQISDSYFRMDYCYQLPFIFGLLKVCPTWSNTDSNFLFPQDQPLATDIITIFTYKLSEKSILTPVAQLIKTLRQIWVSTTPNSFSNTWRIVLLLRLSSATMQRQYTNLPKWGCQRCFLTAFPCNYLLSLVYFHLAG